MKYRPDIDGLRSIAIGTVVLFHAFPEAMPGGFVGVDVFFVISGFLISSIIFADLADGTFSFRDFYARRVCRIFPALILVLAVTMLAAWFLLLPDEWRQLGRHVRGGAFYISNFVLKAEVGYFDEAAELKPLLHLWSLAIEEQFYIVWPPLVVLAFRRRGVLPLLIAAALTASFAYNLVRLGRNPEATFFMPETRVWELLVGCVLAAHARFPFSGLPGRLAGWLGRSPAGLRAGLGVALIVAATTLLDKTMPFPGWRAALPTIGAALLISAGPQAWVNRRVLASAPFVGLGRISYPLYLWHWPLLSLAAIAGQGAPSAQTRVALVGLAVALAALTYRFVERPVRFGGLPRGYAAAGLTAFCVGVGLGGHGLAKGWVAVRSSDFGLDAIVEAAGEWAYPTPDLVREKYQGWKLYSLKGADSAVLFVGDSNAEQYWPRIQELRRQTGDVGKTVYFLTGGGCLPIPGMSGGCGVETALDLVRDRAIGSVVIAGQWWDGFADYRNRIGGRLLSDPAGEAQAIASLQDFIRKLVGDGRTVRVVLNIPTGPSLAPKAMIQRSFLDFAVVKQGIRLSEHGVQIALGQRLRQAAEAAGAEVIDPLPYLCEGDFCPAVTGAGAPIYKDGTHLRPTFVRDHVDFIDRVLLN